MPQPPLPGWHDRRDHPVMCARAGYGVVEVWVGVGVGVAEADGVTEELGDELVVGDADGDVVGVVVADGEVDGDRDGDAGAEVPRAGPTRSGGWTGWPVNSRASTA